MSLKLHKGGAPNPDIDPKVIQGKNTAGADSGARAAFVRTQTITHFPVPEEVKAAARRVTTTRTLLGIAAPVRQIEPPAPDSARVFDLYVAARSSAPASQQPPTSSSALQVADRRKFADDEDPRATPAVSVADLLHSANQPAWPQGLHLVQLLLATMDQNLGTRADHAGSSLPDSSRIEVDSTGAVRILERVDDGPESVYRVSGWLYHFAVGRPPAARERRLPSELNRRLPKWVDAICVRGLTDDVDNRYPNLSELRTDLSTHAPLPSRQDLSNWILQVHRAKQPTEGELAGELSEALTLFTQSASSARPVWRAGWWLAIALTAMLALALGYWLWRH